MNRKKNICIENKGFTLTELLVTMVIFGIIAVLAMPLIRNISVKLDESKFNSYLDTVEASAKLYTDGYSLDLFSYKKSGCAYVYYEQLENSRLLKDIQISNISCNSEDTYVKVVKLGDRYSYSPFIGCGTEKDKKAENVTIHYPKGVDASKTEICDINSGSNIYLTAVPENSGKKYDKKKVNAKLRISSPTGIDSNHDIYVAWSTKEDNYDAVTNWNKVSLNIPSNQEDLILGTETIAGGQTIEVTSPEYTTPADGNGDYYLLVQVNRLQDLEAVPWADARALDGKYISFGPFKVDTTPPTINHASTTSKTSNYNNLNVKIALDAVDNYTPKKELKVCISNSSKECTNAEYKDYKKTNDFKLSGSYDGKERNIYITVKDLAGNKTKKILKYKIYKDCTSIKTSGDWRDLTSCTRKCGGGTKKQVIKATDTNTGSDCTNQTAKNVSCNTRDCCTNVTYKDGKKCSKECGGGTYNRLAYSTIDGSRCPSKDQASGGGKCNTEACCDEVYYEDGSDCTKKCGGGTYNRLAYAVEDGRRCREKDKSSGGSKCNTQDCCSKVTYKDGTTCNKKCGGGTYNRLAYSAIDGSRCPSKDQTSGGAKCNTKDCCATVTYKDGTACTKKCGGGTYNRLAYSTIDGSRCPAKDQSSGGAKCNTSDCCASVTYKDGSKCSDSCGGTYNRLAYSKADGRRCSDKDKSKGGSSCGGMGSWKKDSSWTTCKIYSSKSTSKAYHSRKEVRMSKNGKKECDTRTNWETCSPGSHSHNCKLIKSGTFDSYSKCQKFTCGECRTKGYRVYCDICGARCSFEACPTHHSSFHF